MGCSTMKIRPYCGDDWLDVERIYNDGIATGLATFEVKSKPKEAWEADSIPGSALVAEDAATDEILGWAVLWPTSSRKVYAGVCEVSLYVGAHARGGGVGRKLLDELVMVSEQLGIWTLQAGIFEANSLSLSLHEKCGFRIVGVREKIGLLDGVWKDVILMERRSKVVGV